LFRNITKGTRNAMRTEKLKNSYLENLYKGFYQNQNKKIHTARNQLRMSLDECRKIAEKISGKPSISSLSLEQRYNLIEALNRRGATVINPRPPREFVSPKGRRQLNITGDCRSEGSNGNAACAMETKVDTSNLYSVHLAYWDARFPRERPGFPSNKQLAFIQTLWELYFDDGRQGRGLRGFVFRQTRHLPEGPVSDLAFLKNQHVEAMLTPLTRKAKAVVNSKKRMDDGKKV